MVLRVLNKTRGIRASHLKILSSQCKQSTTIHSNHLFNKSSHHNLLFSVHQTRNQSTTTENNETTAKDEEKNEYKPFIAPRDEAKLEQLPLNLEQTKEALDKLTATISKHSDSISNISKMSNEPPKLFEKYQMYLELMIKLRAEVIKNYSTFNPSLLEAQNDILLRRCFGKWSLKDKEVLDKSLKLHKDLAKLVFNIDLPEQFIMPDRIASGIYQNAQLAANRVVYEDHLNEAAQYSGEQSAEKQIEFMKNIFVPILFREEMKLLKEQEKWLAVSKKKKVLKDNYMDKLREDVNSVSVEDWEKRQQLTFEDLTEEDEKFVLATPEGWVTYKFQLSESRKYLFFMHRRILTDTYFRTVMRLG